MSGTQMITIKTKATEISVYCGKILIMKTVNLGGNGLGSGLFPAAKNMLIITVIIDGALATSLY